jgi:hypothetical protein
MQSVRGMRSHAGAWEREKSDTVGIICPPAMTGQPFAAIVLLPFRQADSDSRVINYNEIPRAKFDIDRQKFLYHPYHI